MDHTEKLIRIAGLIARKREGLLAEKDETFLREWISKKESNKALYDKLMSDRQIYGELEALENVNSKKALDATWKKIEDVSGKSNRRIFRTSMKYAAAILIVIATGLGVYFFTTKPDRATEFSAISDPGTSKAILITPGKEKIMLGENTDELTTPLKKGVKVKDSLAVLAFQPTEALDPNLLSSESNTLITPRGGEYTLVLSDGSRVKLNASSEIVFPDHFAGNTREVKLEGEAYFEVAKADKPFIVHTDKMDVQVYGTSFNISEYEDDPSGHTTLIEGSVGVRLNAKAGKEEYFLTPGEQLSYEENGRVIVQQVDTRKVTAWVYGMFRFDDEDLGSILRELSRWYDFDYEFSNNQLEDKSFTCDLPKKESISSILDMISSASDVAFEVKKEKLVVKYKE